jgi:hypothetical protein
MLCQYALKKQKENMSMGKRFVSLLTAALLCLLLTEGKAGAALSGEEFIKLCRDGTPQAVKRAIEGGADINAEDGDGRTALMLAASNNANPEVTALLLKNGADTQIKDNDGKRAIDFARENEDFRSMEALRQLQEASRIVIER